MHGTEGGHRRGRGRRGRPAQQLPVAGADPAERWAEIVQEARLDRIVSALPPAARGLELACGTGIWTQSPAGCGIAFLSVVADESVSSDPRSRRKTSGRDMRYRILYAGSKGSSHRPEIFEVAHGYSAEFASALGASGVLASDQAGRGSD
jgi:hypothetical protein